MENAALYLVLKFWFALGIRLLYFVDFRLGLAWKACYIDMLRGAADVAAA